MTLSARQRLVLKDITRQIQAEDPDLVRNLSRLGTGPVTAERIAPVAPVRSRRAAHRPAGHGGDRKIEYGKTIGLVAAGLAVLAVAMLFAPEPRDG
ncbi:hypothetical protein FHU36_000563 [Nonomuraea muscovyensis]|uniref:DUF3040 domain-containing protein n=1 Tax=Nonomuraea muscovyensis TaxID=1124761 RepID=A0A7X0BZX2_9ACTN|nr:DUF3040 domain-containing protein [Nonomuraea muscovyensis]MBB6344054.1 hypothetical protein [Nonomuraea muscovyensis]